MNQGQYVFSQLVGHLDRNHFNYLARKYDGNKYVKRFSCWNQLLAMMFGQLSNRESLRDVVVALEAHHSKCKFLGIVHHDMKLERSTYEVLQILSISLTDKTYLTDLFDKTKFNDVKELDCSLIPGIFD